MSGNEILYRPARFILLFCLLLNATPHMQAEDPSGQFFWAVGTGSLSLGAISLLLLFSWASCKERTRLVHNNYTNAQEQMHVAQYHRTDKLAQRTRIAFIQANTRVTNPTNPTNMHPCLAFAFFWIFFGTFWRISYETDRWVHYWFDF